MSSNSRLGGTAVRDTGERKSEVCEVEIPEPRDVRQLEERSNCNLEEKEKKLKRRIAETKITVHRYNMGINTEVTRWL